MTVDPAARARLLDDAKGRSVECYRECALDLAKWPIRTVVAVCLFAICVGCEALIRLDNRYLVDAAPECSHRRPPARPTPIATDAAVEPFVLALQGFDTGAISLDDAGRPLYQDFGFDLDNTCTGEGQGPSCLEPAWADASHHDGVEGIDNAYGELVSPVKSVPETAVAGQTPAELLVRVGAYSGQPDDDQVEVCLYSALGFEDRTGQEAGLAPVWDGEDRWKILPETLVASTDGGAPDVDQPRYCDENAYVAGGVLVAQFADALWPPALELAPAALVPAHGVIMAGPLVDDAGAWEWQNVQVGLRIKLTDALIVTARQNETGSFLCFNETGYKVLKQAVCAVADIRAEDDTASAPCDALSEGFIAQFKQARLGQVRLPEPPLPPCPTEAGTDFTMDTCDLP